MLRALRRVRRCLIVTSVCALRTKHRLHGPLFQFGHRSQLFIGAHDETLSVAMHVYEVCPRKDHRGVDLISAVLPFGHLWHGEPNAVRNAIGYAMHSSRSHDAVIRVYDDGGNVIETDTLLLLRGVCWT